MTRRTTSQAKTDDHAFPIRVKLAIPFEDRNRWWGLQDRLHAWLKALGPRRHAIHSGGWSVKGQAMALYFRTLEDAQVYRSVSGVRAGGRGGVGDVLRAGGGEVGLAPLTKDGKRALAAIGRKRGKSIAQVMLRWLIQQNVVAIPKSVRRERMAENFAVFDFALDDDHVAAIAALDQKASSFFDHRDPKMVEWLGTRRLGGRGLSTCSFPPCIRE